VADGAGMELAVVVVVVMALVPSREQVGAPEDGVEQAVPEEKEAV
jgi:hypothetical protein